MFQWLRTCRYVSVASHVPLSAIQGKDLGIPLNIAAGTGASRPSGLRNPLPKNRLRESQPCHPSTRHNKHHGGEAVRSPCPECAP
ncbi:hypothetical protein NDU88_009357 [Pleurodeles waltl]|uniref:Uncharacterized protein n=1 Tax=Pleurodeles waltl TaxID=8319 RepID=A0AAV7P249_PLEWA|nr:hypothetical protein NDU88_009357 [Pleurodeles waltl]